MTTPLFRLPDPTFDGFYPTYPQHDVYIRLRVLIDDQLGMLRMVREMWLDRSCVVEVMRIDTMIARLQWLDLRMRYRQLDPEMLLTVLKEPRTSDHQAYAPLYRVLQAAEGLPITAEDHLSIAKTVLGSPASKEAPPR